MAIRSKPHENILDKIYGEKGLFIQIKVKKESFFKALFR
jgi:hypothetical protein